MLRKPGIGTGGRVWVLALVAAWALATGCGGGGGAGTAADIQEKTGELVEEGRTGIPDGGQAATPVFYSAASSSGEEDGARALAGFQADLAEGYAEWAEGVLGRNGAVEIAALLDGMEVTPETAARWLELSAALGDELSDALVEGARLVVNAYNVGVAAHGALADGGAARETVRADRRAPLIATAAALSVGAYAVYNVYQQVVQAQDQAQQIVADVARVDEEGRRKVIAIFRDNGVDLPDDATPDQIDRAFQAQWFWKRSRITRAVKDFVAQRISDGGPSGDAYAAVGERHRKNLVEAAKTLGEAAVDATVSAGTTVTGSVGSLLGNETVGAAVDVTLTVTGLDPVSAIKTATLTGMSQETLTVYPAPPAGADPETAQHVFETLAAGDDGALQVTYEDVALAMEALLSQLSVMAGGDGTVLEIPLHVFAGTGEIFADDDGIPRVRAALPEWMQGGTVIVTADGAPARVVEDVDLGLPPPPTGGDEGGDSGDGSGGGEDGGTVGGAGGGYTPVVDAEELTGATRVSVRLRMPATCTWSGVDGSHTSTTTAYITGVSGDLAVLGEPDLSTTGTVTIIAEGTLTEQASGPEAPAFEWTTRVELVVNLGAFAVERLSIEHTGGAGETEYLNSAELEDVPLSGTMASGKTWWVTATHEDVTPYIAGDVVYSGRSQGWDLSSAYGWPLDGCDLDLAKAELDILITNGSQAE